MPENKQRYLYDGFDGYAGFRRFKYYDIEPVFQEDGSVKVFMDHAPQHGYATFSALEWEEWWKLAK